MKTGLIATARALVGAGRGLLVADESNPTCNKRFAKVGIPRAVEMRRAWASCSSQHLVWPTVSAAPSPPR